MQFRPSPLVLSFIVAIIAGLLNLFSKTLMNAGLTSLEVGAVRETGTAVMFTSAMLIFDRSAFKVKLKDVPAFVLFALFNVSSNIAMFTAMSHISMGMASVLQMTSPYFVLILSLALFKIKITARKLVACMVAFFGCVLVVGVLETDGQFNFEGVVLGIFSAITLAAFTIGGKYFGDKGYSENTSMLYFFGLSGLMILPLIDVGEIGEVLTSDITLLADAACLCLVCTLIVNFMIIYITRRMDPGVFSIILSSSVVVSTVLGIIYFGETITYLGIVGMALVLLATVILESDSLFGDRSEHKACK